MGAQTPERCLVVVDQSLEGTTEYGIDLFSRIGYTK